MQEEPDENDFGFVDPDNNMSWGFDVFDGDDNTHEGPDDSSDGGGALYKSVIAKPKNWFRNGCKTKLGLTV